MVLCLAVLIGSASAQVAYPYQEVMFIGSNGNNLNITGYANNSPLNTYHTNGSSNERWRLSTTDGVNFKIVNMTTNTLVSPLNWGTSSGTQCVLNADSARDEQLWQFAGVDRDVNGDFYNYKIANKKNTSLTLTLNSATSITISTYSGSAAQKWRLHSSGLVGFAGFCKDLNGSNKTGTIGGLLGKTVFVSDLAGFKSALLNTSPLTIVIAANIDNANSEVYDLRIESNKTIIGSYAAKRLTDPRMRTDDYFKSIRPSNNIIIKNLDIQVASRGGVVSIAVYGSRNIWVDHCTFNSTLGIDVNEVGKFFWANASVYANSDPDYITLSYNKFSRRYWTIAFGASSQIRNNATVMLNYFESCVRRTPQQGNGRMHCLNNFIQRSSPSLDNAGYAAIISGPGAHTYSDANRFNNFIRESSGYWDVEITTDSTASIKDVGSYTNKGQSAPTATPYLLPTPSGTVTSFSPASKYSYPIAKAYDSSSGNDVKKFCTTHCGAVSSYSALKYIHYPDFTSYLNTSA